MNAQVQSLQEMRASAASPREINLPSVVPGFGSLQSFELIQRQANVLGSSTLVPAAYRKVIEKLDKFGNVKERKENPNALANCIVALNMASRMGADPLMVMQNLYIVEGHPAWSAQWIIASINGCGRFSPLRFDIKSLGKKVIDYATTYWEDGQKHNKVVKVEITDKVCVAWAVEKTGGARVESPPVTIEMAVREGWYSKSGSKWQTMDEVMLRYRASSFFGRIYAPELLMGLQSVEEIHDVFQAQPDGSGGYSVDLETIRAQSETESPEVVTTQPESETKLATDETVAEPVPGAAAESSAPVVTFEAVKAKLQCAADLDMLDAHADLIQHVADTSRIEELGAVYKKRAAELKNPTPAPAATPRRRSSAAPSME